MGKNFRETLNERMQDPAFRAEWDAQEPERQIMRAIVEGREESGMTQKQLSDITGITQADISRLESGTANPSLRTLKRLAAGMGMALKLEFAVDLVDLAVVLEDPAHVVQHPHDGFSHRVGMVICSCRCALFLLIGVI